MKNKIRHILNWQMGFMIVAFILIFLSFFFSILTDIREIIIGLILLMMAYSNQIIYKKVGLTILYVIFALLLIIPNILRLV